MNESLASELISKFFSELRINEIKKIGEGTGNTAFEVNSDYIFRFPKRPENQKQLESEISIQILLASYSTLPFPKFTFVPPDHSFVGYEKLKGVSLLSKRNEFREWGEISKELGSFLGKLHSIRREELNSANLLIENQSFENWLVRGKSFFEETKYLIKEKHYPRIESFFDNEPPNSTEALVLCHNDLGIEHILVKDNKISGVIDWGGVALTDPACDFARIYRDVGENALDLILGEYTAKESIKIELRERAIFYGKCLLFEDLYYGIGQAEYEQKVFDALEWMF